MFGNADSYNVMNDILPVAPATPDSGRWKPVQRGYPEGTEVLTELGWVSFDALYSQEYLSEAVPFVGNGRALPGFAPKDLQWGQWAVNGVFPRLATVNPVSGDIVFVRPSKFIYYLYDGRLAHVKMKGVDILSTLFTDLWLKPKYGRTWKFVLADDVIRNNHSSANYMMINKFSHDMYGWWSPERELLGEVALPVVGVGEPVPGVASTLKAFVESPITVYPRKHAKRERVWSFYEYVSFTDSGERVVADRVRTEVPCFNVDIAPYHNLIIRRGRKDDNPRTLWVGGPVVVGDGSDKSVLRVEGTRGAALGGGSYSILRPDYRTLGADKGIRK